MRASTRIFSALWLAPQRDGRLWLYFPFRLCPAVSMRASMSLCFQPVR